jgi:glycogen synthase
MNLVFVAAEVAPWSKTGGLGDVMGGLPVELAARGHKVMTVAPRYDQYKDAWDTSVVIDVMGEPVRFFHSMKDGVDRVFVDHPWFLAKVWGKTASKLYGKKAGADYADNQKRFRLFCEAAIEAARALPCSPGEECTFVANDWHSALVPVLLKDVYQPAGEFASAKCALCVHNIAFQGRFWREQAAELGLPEASLQRFLFARLPQDLLRAGARGGNLRPAPHGLPVREAQLAAGGLPGLRQGAHGVPQLCPRGLGRQREGRGAPADARAGGHRGHRERHGRDGLEPGDRQVPGGTL